MQKDKQDYTPKILVFTTDKISDPGVDMAGQQHVHYSPSTAYVVVPCSSGIKPRWILRAFNKGFDGVFVAADGTDCPYISNCGEKTGENIKNTQELMEKESVNPKRLKMAAICSVCADAFANHISNFSNQLKELGSIKTEKYNN